MDDRVVLFYPKTGSESHNFRVPLSILAVGTFLGNAGFDVKIVDANAEPGDYKSRVVGYCREHAILLGISAMTGYQIYDGIDTARAVRAAVPELPIVWGGCHPSIMPEQTVAHPLVDVVVRGQGEETMTELARAFQRHLRPNKKILGTTFKNGGGKIVSAERRPFKDINEFPKLAYRLLANDYVFSDTDVGKRCLNYYTSIGCPHRCTFCANARMYGLQWRGLNPARVVSEIEALVQQYDLDGLLFDDVNFFVDRKRVERICGGMTEKKIGIRWVTSGRSNYLNNYDNKTMELVKRSGCVRLEIGAESGSDRILTMIEKGVSARDILASAEICRRHGIIARYSFMTGFPSETEEDTKLTLDLIDKIFSVSEMHKVFLFIYTPYPGTPLFDAAIKSGLKAPRTLDEWSTFMFDRVNVPWFTRQREKFVKTLSDIFYYSHEYEPNAGALRRIVKMPLKQLSLLRWKHRFFGLPIEWELVWAIRRMRGK